MARFRLVAVLSAFVLSLPFGLGQATADPPEPKVTICHKPGTPAEKTKEVPATAVEGHMRHGDTAGAC